MCIRDSALSATVPAGLTHGAAQASVKAAPPVIGAIASLKSTLMTESLIGTPVVLSAGATDVTVGASAVLASMLLLAVVPLSLHPVRKTQTSKKVHAVA